MAAELQLDDFDPSGVAAAGSLFGLPHTAEQAALVILPVPWEVTVSYRTGTAAAPEAIRQASLQVDLYDAEHPEAWRRGIHLLPVNAELAERAAQLRTKAAAHIDEIVAPTGADTAALVAEVNAASRARTAWVKEQTLSWLRRGKLVALLGGDHSTPMGFFEAVGEHYGEFGILQIDAHADLREAYEDFEQSHASVMYNALALPQLTRLVQVGLRDLGHSEVALAAASEGRVVQFTQRGLRRGQHEGETWAQQVARIVAALPERVYVSFDIDGLDPSLCPHTGTPVPDGLGFEQTLDLIEAVVRSGRRIVGVDLNEVGIPADVPEGEDAWDAIVGARVLYRLALAQLASNP